MARPSGSACSIRNGHKGLGGPESHEGWARYERDSRWRRGENLGWRGDFECRACGEGFWLRGTTSGGSCRNGSWWPRKPPTSDLRRSDEGLDGTFAMRFEWGSCVLDLGGFERLLMSYFGRRFQLGFCLPWGPPPLKRSLCANVSSGQRLHGAKTLRMRYLALSPRISDTAWRLSRRAEIQQGHGVLCL